MDPEAPKPEKPEDSSPTGAGSARKRADSLSSGNREEKKQTAGDEASAKPVLTEKQRIEARRKRQARRRRPVQGNPLSKGFRAVGFEVRRTGAFLGSAVIAALASLGPVFSSVGMGLVWLIERIGKGLKALGRLVARAVGALGKVVVAADRMITPHRALLLVAAIAAVLLGVSQFKGLGAIEIGQPGYTGIEDLARAPAVDRTTPAGIHTRILVPIAAVAFLAVVIIGLGGVKSMTRRFGRWRRLASMVLVTIGLLTLVVALAIDLPDATDTAEWELAYAGVKAVLLSGFWLEVAAGAVLTFAGFALLLEPSARPAKSRRRERHPSAAAGSRA